MDQTAASVTLCVSKGALCPQNNNTLKLLCFQKDSFENQ